jgi:hypothetical protein
MAFSPEQIHLLTAYGYYYDRKVNGNIFTGRSILNGVSWKIVRRAHSIFDVYVWARGAWKRLRSVVNVEFTYGVLDDYESEWCRRHPVHKVK